jgi:hypothetical protein
MTTLNLFVHMSHTNLKRKVKLNIANFSIYVLFLQFTSRGIRRQGGPTCSPASLVAYADYHYRARLLMVRRESQKYMNEKAEMLNCR